MPAYQSHDPNKVTKNHIFLISNHNWSDFDVLVGDLTDLMAKEPTMMSSEITDLLKDGTVILCNKTLIQTFNYEVRDMIEISGNDYIIDSVFTQADPLSGINKLLVTLMDVSCLLGLLKVEEFEDFDRNIEKDIYLWKPTVASPFTNQSNTMYSIPVAKHTTFRSANLETPIVKYEEPEKHKCTCSNYDLFNFGCKCGGK